jgi:hypothetical protein
VTAWAEYALITGRVKNCIKKGNETEYRNKMYTTLIGPEVFIQDEKIRNYESKEDIKEIKEDHIKKLESQYEDSGSNKLIEEKQEITLSEESPQEQVKTTKKEGSGMKENYRSAVIGKNHRVADENV